MSIQTINFSGVSAIRTLHKTSDAAFTTTTLGDVPELVFDVRANHYYLFEFSVVFQSSSTSTGLQIGLTVPTFDRYAASVDIPVDGDGNNANFRGHLTTSGDSVDSPGVDNADQDYMCVIKGVIFPNTEGQINVQAALETGESGTITIQEGSWGTLHDLGT